MKACIIKVVASPPGPSRRRPWGGVALVAPIRRRHKAALTWDKPPHSRLQISRYQATRRPGTGNCPTFLRALRFASSLTRGPGQEMAFYTCSIERYEPCTFRDGSFYGTPEAAFETAALYLRG